MVVLPASAGLTNVPTISAVHASAPPFSFMQLPSDKVLSSGSESTAFLILAWEEMFDAYAPDTFQPRLFNVPLLIAELHSVASKALVSDRWLPHVKAIQDELGRAVEWDQAFLAGLPYLRWATDLVSKKTAPKEIAEIAKTLSVHEIGFHQLAQQQLRSAVTNLPQRKEAVFRALRRLATIAVNAGFKQEDFQDLCDAGSFARSATDWTEDLIQRTDLSGKQIERTYRCTFAIDAEAKLLKRVAKKLRFKLESPGSVDKALRDTAPKASFISVEERGRTPSEALQSATRKVRPTLDIFNFYSRSYSMTMFPDAAVSTSGSASVLLTVGAQSLRKLSTRRSALKLAARAISEIMPRLLTGQIFNALEHYTLAQTSSAYRVKLVNLWAAIECLGTASPTGPVIDRVQATVVPIVTWRRIDKITRYIATTLTAWRNARFIASLGPGFLDKGVVSAEEVLLALSKPENHPDVVALLSATAPHPLLCNRIFSLWKIFSQPLSLLRDTETSRQRTCWHLLRIYRARNLIVHYGEEVPCVPHLLDHLQYYFSLTLSRILDSLSSHENWTVNEAIAHWTQRADYILYQLRHDATALRVRDFFPRPIRRIHEGVWT